MKRLKQLERCKASADKQIKIVKRNIKKDDIVLVEVDTKNLDALRANKILVGIHNKFSQMNIRNYVMMPKDVSISTVGLDNLIRIRSGIDTKIKELKQVAEINNENSDNLKYEDINKICNKFIDIKGTLEAVISDKQLENKILNNLLNNKISVEWSSHAYRFKILDKNIKFKFSLERRDMKVSDVYYKDNTNLTSRLFRSDELLMTNVFRDVYNQLSSAIREIEIILNKINELGQAIDDNNLKELYGESEVSSSEYIKLTDGIYVRYNSITNSVEFLCD